MKNVKVEMKPLSVIKARLNIQKGGPAHAYFTKRCADYMDKFVPMNMGNLRKNITIETDKIIYESPYSHYQYKGVREDGTHKVNNYTTPGTGPYWDKKMWSAEKDKITQEVQKYVETHGG